MKHVEYMVRLVVWHLGSTAFELVRASPAAPRDGWFDVRRHYQLLIRVVTQDAN